MQYLHGENKGGNIEYSAIRKQLYLALDNKCRIFKIFMKIRTLKDSSGLKPNLRED